MQTDTGISDTNSVPQSHILGNFIWLFSLIVTTPFQNHLHQSQGPDELFSGKEIQTSFGLVWFGLGETSRHHLAHLIFQAELNLKSEHVAQGLVLPRFPTFSAAQLCSQENIFPLCLFRISLVLA